MAELIALKNRATAAINGEVSSDGLSAMLGSEDSLQSMLIENVKKGGEILKGSAEDWINQTSDRARELLANIGKKKQKPSILEQFVLWVETEIKGKTTKVAMLRGKEQLIDNIKSGNVPGFVITGDILQVDLIEAFGFDRNFIADGAILYHLSKPQLSINKATHNEPINLSKERSGTESVIQIVEIKKTTPSKGNRKKKPVTSEGQLAFDLFA